MKVAGTYRIEHRATGRFYIGQAWDIDRRWKDHKRMLKGNRHGNRFLQSVANKYGIDSLTFTITARFDPMYLNVMEQMALTLMKGDPKCMNLNYDVKTPPNSTGLKRGPQSVVDRAKKRATLMGESIDDALVGLSEKTKVMKGVERVVIKQQRAAFDGLLAEYETLYKAHLYVKQKVAKPSLRKVLNLAVYHQDGTNDVIESVPQFTEKYGLNKTMIKKLVAGKVASYKGWHLVEPKTITNV